MNFASNNKPVINEIIPSSLSDKFIPDEFPVKVPNKAVKKLESSGDFKSAVRLFAQKRWEEALDEFLHIDKSGFSSDQRVDYAYFLGLCYTKLEQFEDGLLYLEQVIIDGSDALRVYQCRMTLAYIYIKTNRIRMAENELKRLRSSGFESAQLYNTLGYSSYMQKRYRDAVDLYDKALDFDKDNATALNCMGFILADTGMDKMKGLRLCRRAVEQNPHNPAYLDSLGWAYYKNGEMTEARSLLRRALELAPQEEEIKEHFRIASKGVL